METKPPEDVEPIFVESATGDWASVRITMSGLILEGWTPAGGPVLLDAQSLVFLWAAWKPNPNLKAV